MIDAEAERIIREFPLGIVATVREDGIPAASPKGTFLVLDKTTTGDGLISALQVLAVMKETGKPLSELVAGMPRYPQAMINVRIEQRLVTGCDHRLTPPSPPPGLERA